MPMERSNGLPVDFECCPEGEDGGFKTRLTGAQYLFCFCNCFLGMLTSGQRLSIESSSSSFSFSLLLLLLLPMLLLLFFFFSLK